jgi:putative ABC transport system permease protein
VLSRIAASFVAQVQMPGVIVVIAAGAVLLASAVCASLMPAARAARTNVIEALRAE